MTKKISFGLLTAVLISCTANKKLYELPDEMLPHVKVEYDQICIKGQRLYNLNCAGCHTQKIGFKSYIPDFSQDQLQGYSIRISNALHETNMPDSLVSEEELVLISTFLGYKKKNTEAVAKKMKPGVGK